MTVRVTHDEGQTTRDMSFPQPLSQTLMVLHPLAMKGTEEKKKKTVAVGHDEANSKRDMRFPQPLPQPLQ